MSFRMIIASGLVMFPALLATGALAAQGSAGKLVLEDFFTGNMTATGVFNNTRDGTHGTARR
jgi:hypothetical protein